MEQDLRIEARLYDNGVIDLPTELLSDKNVARVAGLQEILKKIKREYLRVDENVYVSFIFSNGQWAIQADDNVPPDIFRTLHQALS